MSGTTTPRQNRQGLTPNLIGGLVSSASLSSRRESMASRHAGTPFLAKSHFRVQLDIEWTFDMGFRQSSGSHSHCGFPSFMSTPEALTWRESHQSRLMSTGANPTSVSTPPNVVESAWRALLSATASSGAGLVTLRHRADAPRPLSPTRGGPNCGDDTSLSDSSMSCQPSACNAEPGGMPSVRQPALTATLHDAWLAIGCSSPIRLKPARDGGAGIYSGVSETVVSAA